VRETYFLDVLRLQKELYYVGRKEGPPTRFSVKNFFVFKDAHNVRKNGKIRGSIGVIMHIRKSENVKKRKLQI
jgi:hypothetical protein